MQMTAKTEERLRQTFKEFNRFMVGMWRLGLGRWINAWPDVGGRILVIVHRGRKTGLRRLTPVNYAIVDGEIYVTAGFGSISDWYRNIQADPQVEIWLPEGRRLGTAEEISDHPQRLNLLRQVLIGSGIVAPMMGIHPRTMSDSDLEALTSSYRLVHLKAGSPISGPGGPGDLTWVWLPAGLLVVALLLIPRRRRH